MSAVRTFVGIPLESAFRDSLEDASACLRDLDPSWRNEKWTARENLHVTLKFVGGVPEDELDALGDAIAEAVGERPGSFQLPFDGVKAVPSLRRARMLWATFLDPDDACSALAAAVERAVLAFGAELDDRQFVPHVTLVRARRPHSVSEDAFEAGAVAASHAPELMSVTQVTLFSSTLTPKGPIYSELRSYPLGSD